MEPPGEGAADAQESVGSDEPGRAGIWDERAPHISRIKLVWALLGEAVLVTALFVASVVISACISRADNVNWEAIAQCESGGNWAAGNRGGLQISQASRGADSGVGTPAAASPQQQVKVADNMATQGSQCLAEMRLLQSW